MGPQRLKAEFSPTTAPRLLPLAGSFGDNSRRIRAKRKESIMKKKMDPHPLASSHHLLVIVCFSLLIAGCATEGSLRAVSSGKIGCPLESTEIRDFKRSASLPPILTWIAACNQRSYQCSGNLEHSTCVEIRVAPPGAGLVKPPPAGPPPAPALGSSAPSPTTPSPAGGAGQPASPTRQVTATPAAPPVPAPTARAAEPALPSVVTVSLDSVNLRDAASMQGKVITVLRRGTELPMMGKDGEWFAVSWSGGTAYIHQSTVSVK